MNKLNADNSEHLRDFTENLEIDNNLLADKIEPFQENMGEPNRTEEEKRDGVFIENQGNRYQKRISERRVQHINSGSRNNSTLVRYDPFLFGDSVLVDTQPVILRQEPIIIEKPVIKKDSEIHSSVNKFIIILIILILLTIVGFFLLRKNY